MPRVRRKRDAAKQQKRRGGDDEVADRTCHGNQNIVHHRIAKISRVHGCGLRPAEQRNAANGRDQRQYDGANRVNVANRIQRHPSQHASRRIATAGRSPGMGGLVHADREQECDHLIQDFDDSRRHWRMPDSNKGGELQRSEVRRAWAKPSGGRWRVSCRRLCRADSGARGRLRRMRWLRRVPRLILDRSG